MAGGEDGVLQTSGSAAELGHLGGREVEGRRRLVEEEDAEAPRNREAIRVVEVQDAPPPPCRGGRSRAAGARVKSRQPRAAPSKSSACAGQGGAGGLEEKGDREITSGASAMRPEISPVVRYVDAKPLHHYAGGGGIGKGEVRPARAAPLSAAAMGATASSAATDRPRCPAPQLNGGDPTAVAATC